MEMSDAARVKLFEMLKRELSGQCIAAIVAGRPVEDVEDILWQRAIALREYRDNTPEPN